MTGRQDCGAFDPLSEAWLPFHVDSGETPTDILAWKSGMAIPSETKAAFASGKEASSASVFPYAGEEFGFDSSSRAHGPKDFRGRWARFSVARFLPTMSGEALWPRSSVGFPWPWGWHPHSLSNAPRWCTTGRPFVEIRGMHARREGDLIRGAAADKKFDGASLDLLGNLASRSARGLRKGTRVIQRRNFL